MIMKAQPIAYICPIISYNLNQPFIIISILPCGFFVCLPSSISCCLPLFSVIFSVLRFISSPFLSTKKSWLTYSSKLLAIQLFVRPVRRCYGRDASSQCAKRIFHNKVALCLLLSFLGQFLVCSQRVKGAACDGQTAQVMQQELLWCSSLLPSATKRSVRGSKTVHLNTESYFLPSD